MNHLIRVTLYNGYDLANGWIAECVLPGCGEYLRCAEELGAAEWGREASGQECPAAYRLALTNLLQVLLI